MPAASTPRWPASSWPLSSPRVRRPTTRPSRCRPRRSSRPRPDTVASNSAAGRPPPRWRRWMRSTIAWNPRRAACCALPRHGPAIWCCRSLPWRMPASPSARTCSASTACSCSPSWPACPSASPWASSWRPPWPFASGSRTSPMRIPGGSSRGPAHWPASASPCRSSSPGRRSRLPAISPSPSSRCSPPRCCRPCSAWRCFGARRHVKQHKRHKLASIKSISAANMRPSDFSDEFPLDPGLIYLNHAAVSPWPRRTAEAVKRFAEENLHQGGRDYPRWLETEIRLREQCRSLLNAPSADDIALLKNTSEALSVVAHGLTWQAGDNVVISDQEFPSNRIVWQSLQDQGVETRCVDLSRGATPEPALGACMDERTRLLAISSVQYASGLWLDLAQLGAYCRARGVLFCIDAIQSLGALPLDVQACGADFAMADGHIWLLGPVGCAEFYARAEARDRLRLRQYGWHMVAHPLDVSRHDWQPAASARRFECGSPNMLGIHALSASLALLAEVGMETVAGRVLENSAWLMEALSELPGVEILTPRQPGRYAGIVSFRHRRIDAADLHHHLLARNVICAQRGDGVRFSPHFHTTGTQLATAVAAVEFEAAAVDPDALRCGGDQMHLDPAQLRVVEGFMAEGREVEIGIQLTVDPRQQVQVELRGDALAVIVGGMQARRGFLEIDADQQPAFRADDVGDAPQQIAGLAGIEIADAGTGEEG